MGDSRQLLKPCELILHFYGGPEEIVVFNETAGETHLLDGAAGLIVRSVYQQPLQWDDLWNLVIQSSGGSCDSETTNILDEIVENCAGLGLIEVKQS